MELAIKKIQTFFRLKLLKKQIYTVSLINITDNKTFEEFSLFIRNPNLIDNINKIINLITLLSKNNHNLIAQEFLSAFLINSYHEYIITNEPSIIIKSPDYNKLILIFSRKIVNDFENFYKYPITLYKIRFFNKLLIMYKIIFNNWKKQDMSDMIFSLTRTYYELDKIKKNILNSDTTISELPEPIKKELDFCTHYQNDILEKLDKLDQREFFNNYKPEEINLDEHIQKQIKETMLQAFWDKFKLDLEQEPPNLNQLKNLLNDLQQIFCSFIPNNRILQNEIIENIDPDLIINMISHNAFEDKDLKKLAIYIISLVKKFQPAIMDREVEEWEEMMLEEFNKKFKYSDFLVIFMKSVFNMIETINLFIQEYNNTINQN